VSTPEVVPSAPPVPDAPVTPPEGLSDAEVAARTAAGSTNATTVRTSRTLAQIVHANVFTFFNGLLASLFVLVALTGAMAERPVRRHRSSRTPSSASCRNGEPSRPSTGWHCFIHPVPA
jgi:hypothetical protein